MALLEIILIVLVVISGGLAAYFYQKAQKTSNQLLDLRVESEKGLRDLDGQKSKLEERNELLTIQTQEQKIELEESRNAHLELNRQYAGLKSNYQNLQEKLQENKAEQEKLREKFTFEFKNLANEILEEKSKKFTDQNKTNLSEILNPLREKIQDFEKKIEHSNKENLTWNTALKEQISGLKELNQQMSREAENLTRALKGDAKIQGNWGEFILESILEKSGLVKDREYSVQPSYTENGRRYQPDIIINLPDEKHIIIDAKVSLVAYERFSSCENEADQLPFIKEHLQSIRGHLKNLNHKGYQQLYQLKSLDFVLLFIPIEPALSLAIQHDNQLFTDAFEKNIVIVSPSTLLATLRTIASIWRQENQNRNALEIARQSGDLYDKFKRFVDDLQKMGNQLNTLQNTYTDSMKKLSEGKGNLIARAEKIRKLGAKTSSSFSGELIERALEDED